MVNLFLISNRKKCFPFGLLHRGYNEEKEDLKYDKEQDFIFTVQAQAGRYKYKFQGQERQEDLDLGWDSFKYRNYDYAIGRFFNVDPLAEKFPYNSTYAFQENKLGLGRELEGLELVSPVYSISDVILLEGSMGRYPMIRPISEETVETSIERPTGGPWWEFLRYGSRVHREQQAKWAEEGWQVERWLGRLGGKGNRVDGFKIEQSAGRKIGFIRELKPNTSWGRRAGIKQLERYIEAAAKKYPDVEEWQPILQLYNSGKAILTGMFYKVQKGDNLTKIAKQFGTSIDNLTQLNNISNPDKINAGEVLLIDFSIRGPQQARQEMIKPADATYVAPPRPEKLNQ